MVRAVSTQAVHPPPSEQSVLAPPAAVLVVRRGFSDAVERSSTSFDLGDDVVSGLGPREGLRVVVPVRRPQIDCRLELSDRPEARVA